ncbi:hypothetical protein J3F84DRAFT_398948 [Trichoderma pleuroticola]
MCQPIQLWSHKVEHPNFLKKIAAGCVPLIHDPATGMVLMESNIINHLLLDHYDKNNTLSPATEQDKYLSPSPILVVRDKKNFDGVAQFQHLLRGKEFPLGGKCTLADLVFIP